MVVVAVIGVMTAMATMGLSRWREAEEVNTAAREVAGAFLHAHAEAIRTGNSHIIFFQTDIAGADLENVSGDTVPILILDDGRPGAGGDSGNCEIDPGEPIETFSLVGNVGFGVTASTARVPIDDGATAFGGVSTFSNGAGGAATWVLFRSDGTPRAINGACVPGALGSGGGGIYLSNATRDAAIVLTPLGIPRSFAWDPAGSTWN